ncbi:DNA ligase-associated DEXH box helicase [Alteromonas sp. KUL42]|uniref:ligase-associated DNA damage response DEXH box helicase n=1 Tax=Alteromonas sp. KUL42 TaxID=2480797 RepID=UPI0010357F50|nr:ligase-associated DNA damage response DEXH box helicase [Alteromonas sp. KUL42]TAP33016.1 ligase-associated DNA damage response DEXH box helicase [Alteromonas sp. KUL42]GEA08610.1 DNA ligase-associated DEXH box helicase [Alteromonas sp. KUL42]
MTMIPSVFADWFKHKGWQLRDYQRHMLEEKDQHNSTLLIAPTGAGKTLSGFLPSLVELSQQLDKSDVKGLHTLYISPLKALTQDIHRNLLQPIEEMGLSITAETRTGDTPSHKRQRQRKKPPHILLTTPESLMLMLSYADADKLFGKLKRVIIDETHSLMANKRGDFLSLALARLNVLSPSVKRIGLSATVAFPETLGAWLAGSDGQAHIIKVNAGEKPNVHMLHSKARMPFGGFMARYAIEDIYHAIEQAETTLVFVNTRAQSELLFQMLWEANKAALPIALYHGSLSKEQRRKTEAMMAGGFLRAVVCTSALELGIDWGNVDKVIQVGAPKGVSRLLQRIGRANHRLDEPSEALLVPANRFEALECQAAIVAIDKGELDGESPQAGALDIIPQFILNCLCSSADTPDNLYQQILNATPYQGLERDDFDKLWQFTQDGGNALNAYERYQRLTINADGTFSPANRRVIQRHRQNIGTIVEAGRLKVKRIRRGNQGKIIGEVEEYFAQQLTPGDTFYFAGEVLKFEAIRDMQLHAKPAKAKEPKIPSYAGGQMPLSTYLADGVRALLADRKTWQSLPSQVREWLTLQEAFSQLPQPGKVLVEQFPFRQAYYTLYYTFDGRKANQTLGMLLTRRMEKMGVKPLSFSVTDYGLSVASVNAVSQHQLQGLFQPDILGDELEDWMLHAPMLKRSFRQVAVVSGLTEQRYHASQKTMKQVTFSTDLIYDTLREHDPDHILLKVARADAERELLDLKRLANLLIRYVDNATLVNLAKPSPMAIPIVLDVRSEQIKGAGAQAVIEQANLYAEAESMLDEVRALLSGNTVLDNKAG